MANNFFLSQDPLLYQTPFTQNRMSDEMDLQKRYNETMQQYQYYQQQQGQQPTNIANNGFDYMNELDKAMRDMTPDMLEDLKANGEYSALNGQLTEIVQKELMATIKWRINTNNIATQNINRQIEIINNVRRDMDDEQRRNMNELNDYMKNYSNITFDEYRRIKGGATTNGNAVTES